MRGLKDSKGTSPLADRQIPVGCTGPPEPCASYESGPRLSLGPLRWLLRVLLAEVRWESFGVVWVEEAVAAASSYAERVSEGFGQICCQEAEFLWV